MHKIYIAQNRKAQVAEESLMKTPRTSTISFLRNFARAYTYTPDCGTLIYN